MGLVPYVPPPASAVPPFAPLRVRGGRHRLRRAVHRRRRVLAAGLAMTAAALAASAPRDPGRPQAAAVSGREEIRHEQPHRDVVSAPVRIADAATVRLLRPGDRVDVIASGDSPDGGGRGGDARVVAVGARVAEVPDAREGGGSDGGADGGSDGGSDSAGGALIVLAVTRATATELAGASASSRLAVTLC
ncbi:RcpC/CpaB family pilus assembly protein [Streptomyces beijiangensis]|uniref:Flp pilus assembly protein RcpC/CpaB domain-containing protein n=1 Tax=Streptomyces beijiangensis TaxID=163361 RepID=A0A939JH44_9ACTN|nr:RcpC/CpaB family pilus assembly protein [Streptomyces beijiangensis]MBO0512222.1 hypothetical protein [Streptomyces beijiangensis]